MRDELGANYRFAATIVNELVELGVVNFVISPGSRSAPLAIAVSDNSKAVANVHSDERGAAFFALGLGKSGGVPAALICTSGSAVANYLPAVVEARYSRTPLIILSADRPLADHGIGANQTIDQQGIFGGFVRFAYQFDEPDSDFDRTAVSQVVSTAWRSSVGANGGPVHLNLLFKRPIIEIGSAHGASSTALISDKTARRTTIEQSASATHGAASYQRIMEAIASSKRAVVIVGRLANPPQSLQVQANLPILADITSGLRSIVRSGEVATKYNLYLHAKAVRELLRPDLIVHLGGELVGESAETAPLFAYLQGAGCNYLHLDSHDDYYNPLGAITDHLSGDPSQALLAIASKSSLTSALDASFAKIEAVAEEIVGEEAEKDFSDWQVVHSVVTNLTVGSALFLGNSLPVRQADALFPISNRGIKIGVNRGVSGIDGTIATAIGFARESDLPTTLLIGDLATFHDLNSLELCTTLANPFTIVLINNGGGAIFSMLPYKAQCREFERFFTAPVKVNFSAIAQAFQIEYHAPITLIELKALLENKDLGRSPTLIEVKTPPEQATAGLKAVGDKVAGSVLKLL